MTTTTLRNHLVLAIIPLLFVSGLVFYKTRASLPVLQAAWTKGVIGSRPAVVSFGSQASAVNAFDRSINYFVVIGPALIFGILIGAAIRAYVSPEMVRQIFAGRGARRQLRAGLAGTPLMLCSCCVTPIFSAVYESSQSLAAAVTLMLASPVLNPAALVLTFILFGPVIGGMRLLMAMTSVALIGPGVEALFPGKVVPGVCETSWNKPSFGRALYTVAVRTLPALIIGLLCSMFIVQWLPAGTFASATPRILAIIVAASIAVPLALPTFLEIPLALSLLAAGLPVGAAIALLFAGPAINLPSLFATGRLAGWKVAAAVAGLVWVIAVIGGLLI